ncbi:MAG TPA: alpha/beta hydrolase [Dehalococcoidia bacterium]
MAEQLADEARIFCPDLLGFGRAPRPSAAYSVADHLAALDACRDSLALGSEPVILAGQSAGSVLALAGLPPGRSGLPASGCWRCLLIRRSKMPGDTSVPFPRWHRRPWTAPTSEGSSVSGLMCVGRPLWQRLMPLVMRQFPADMARDMVLQDRVSYRNTCNNVLVDHRCAPSAAQVAKAKIPVQMLHGSKDKTAPLAHVQQLAGQFGWPLTVLEGRGHRLLVEAPHACAGTIRTLLADNMAIAGH